MRVGQIKTAERIVGADKLAKADGRHRSECGRFAPASRNITNRVAGRSQVVVW